MPSDLLQLKFFKAIIISFIEISIFSIISLQLGLILVSSESVLNINLDSNIDLKFLKINSLLLILFPSFYIKDIAFDCLVNSFKYL